jgi:hypothetical protein
MSNDYNGLDVLKLFAGMFLLAILVLLLITMALTYVWFVVLLVAAMGLWTLIPAIGIPILCLWLASRVAQ